MRDMTNGWADAIHYLTTGKLEAMPKVNKEVYVTQLSMDEVVSYFMNLKNKASLTETEKEKLSVCKERLIVYAIDSIHALNEIRAEILEEEKVEHIP